MIEPYGRIASDWITRCWIVAARMSRTLPIAAKRLLSCAGDASGIGGSGGVLPNSGLARHALRCAFVARAALRWPAPPARASSGGELAGVLAPGRRGVALGLRQRARVDLHDVGQPAADDRLAVAVDDVAARRGDRDVADAVLVGLGEVLVAGQHLQEPEAEEDDPEQRERDEAERRRRAPRAPA